MIEKMRQDSRWAEKKKEQKNAYAQPYLAMNGTDTFSIAES